MAGALTIAGETGKTLDATVRTVDSLRILLQSVKVTYRSLASDTLEWTALMDTAAGGGTIIPDEGQKVSLYQDGTRKFCGRVTSAKPLLDRVVVLVEGGWKWLNDTALAVDSNGNATIMFVGAVGAAIRGLISPAITAGAPVALGTVGDFFTMMQLTVTGQTYGSVIADMMSLVPDATAWFDHSGSGWPSFNVTRRADMSTKTWTVGDGVTDLQIVPLPNQVVSRVDIMTATRATDGSITTVNQGAGVSRASAVAAGTLQSITLNGPGIDTYLPDTSRQNTSVQSATTDANYNRLGYANSGGASYYVSPYYGVRVINLEDRFSAAKASLGEIYVPSNCRLAVGNLNSIPYKQSTSGGTLNYQLAPLQYLSNGSPVSTAGKYLLLTTTIPDWLRTAGLYSFIDIKITGQIYFLYLRDAGNAPPWMGLVGAPDRQEAAVYNADNTGLGWYVWNFSIPAILVNHLWSSPATLYEPLDWDFIAPPSDLAANLLAAQNWKPWDGPITALPASFDLTNYLPYKHRVSGAAAGAATADALAREIQWTPGDGKVSVNLGAPARADFKSLQARLRASGKDNIRWI